MPTSDTIGDQSTRFNYKLIQSTDDLPSVENGRHQLEDNTKYEFDGIVVSQYGLELGENTPLFGQFGSSDGFICTGGGPAFYSRGNPFFVTNFYGHSPGGQLFDLQADSSTEFLCYFSAFSDAANIGNISNLGAIDGFRVPTFNSVNLEEFDAGLTMTGSPDKIYFNSDPMRNVTASGVTIITFDSNLDVDIADFAGSFVKGVQSDTEVVRVETGATPRDMFYYRGMTHDDTVLQDNIMMGEASPTNVGYFVRDSKPLFDSHISGNQSLSEGNTIEISISTAGEPVEVLEANTVGGSIPYTSTLLDKSSVVEPMKFNYDGKYETHDVVHANLSISAATTIAQGYIGLNGTELPRSRQRVETRGTGSSVTLHFLAEVDMVQNDKISLFLENNGSTGNIKISSINFVL